ERRAAGRLRSGAHRRRRARGGSGAAGRGTHPRWTGGASRGRGTRPDRRSDTPRAPSARTSSSPTPLASPDRPGQAGPEIMRRSGPKLTNRLTRRSHERAEIGAVDRGEDEVGGGDHRRAPRPPVEKAHLAEALPGPDASAAAVRRADLRLARADEEVAVGALALGEDGVARTHPLGPHSRRDARELHRVEPAEEGKAGERVTLVDRRADAPGDLVALGDPAMEVAAVEGPELGRLRGAHRRGPRHAVEERKLPEALAGDDHRALRLAAGEQHLAAPRPHEVKAVARLAVGHDDVARGEPLLDEVIGDRGERGARQAAKKADPIEERDALGDDVLVRLPAPCRDGPHG